MSTLQPLDDNGHPISIMGYVPNGTVKLAIGTSSARVAVAERVEVISVFATAACRFEIGGADVVASAATSPYLHPGVYLDLPLPSTARHVAFVTESGTGQAYVIGRA